MSNSTTHASVRNVRGDPGWHGQLLTFLQSAGGEVVLLEHSRELIAHDNITGSSTQKSERDTPGAIASASKVTRPTDASDEVRDVQVVCSIPYGGYVHA